MKRILVPCDFSEQAMNAYRTALDIAARSDGAVHLVHIIELPVLHDSALMPVLSFEESLFKELEERAREEFGRMQLQYPSEAQIITNVSFGPPARMILDYIKEQNVDLVVMGTKGVTGMREFIVGSNTEKIVRRSPVPVLAIRKYTASDSIREIVFPKTSDAEDLQGFVNEVKALQKFFRARLHLVFINTPTNFISDTITYERLKAFAEHYRLENYTVNVFNDPYEESGIINFTHFIKADMIVMGTHGRKGLAHIVSGSLTEDVVNHIDVPIWTRTIR